MGGNDAYSDRLEGGAGYDEYHINVGDIINDSDGGTIYFGGRQLPSLILKQMALDGIYEDDNALYSATYDSGSKTLQVSGLKGSAPQTFTIENFSSGKFGITLQDKPALTCQWTMPGNPINDDFHPLKGGIQDNKKSGNGVGPS